MINRKAKFFVGLFMAGGICIAVVAIIWLGMNRFFEKGQFYAVYFDESVQGLKNDSPVKYRGVSIGHVEQIGLAADSRLIEVVLKIDSNIKLEDNVVAQQKAVGITGSKFIELDRQIEGIETHYPRLKFPTEHRVLASRPSNISELFRSVDDIVKKLNSFDLVGISDRLKIALANLDQSLNDFDAKGISNNIKTSLANLNKDFDPAKWSKLINGLENNISSLDGVVNNTNDLIRKASGLMDRTGAEISNLSRHLLLAGQNLEKATGNLDRLLEQLSDQPSQLMFGDPPQRRKIDN